MHLRCFIPLIQDSYGFGKCNVKRHVDERRFQTQVWSLGVILYESGEAQVFLGGGNLGMARLMDILT